MNKFKTFCTPRIPLSRLDFISRIKLAHGLHESDRLYPRLRSNLYNQSYEDLRLIDELIGDNNIRKFSISRNKSSPNLDKLGLTPTQRNNLDIDYEHSFPELSNSEDSGDSTTSSVGGHSEDSDSSLSLKGRPKKPQRKRGVAPLHMNLAIAN